MVLQLNRSGGPVPGQSYCAPALGRLVEERQRERPCVKGAVGERRLRDCEADCAS